MVVAPGETVQLSPWTVANVGLLPSGGFSNGFYLSTNTTISTNDAFLDTNSNLSLPSGGSFEWGGPTLTIPADTPAGDYFIGILVDRAGQVPELNESNNFVSTPLTVGAIVDPDLTLSAQPPGISVTEIGPGQTLTFSQLSVVNNGGPTGVSGSLGYYLSTDSVISDQDQFLGRRSVIPLDQGQSTTIFTADVTLPAGVQPGNYWLGVLVDNLDALSESNELNNQLVFEVTVTGSSGLKTLVANTSACESGGSLALSHYQPVGSSFDVASATRFTVASGEVWRPERITAFGSQNFADSTTEGRVRFYSSKTVSCGPRCLESLPDALLCDLPVDVLTDDVLTLDLPQSHSCELEDLVWMSVQQARSDCTLGLCETWRWDQANLGGVFSAPWVIRDVGGTSSSNSCDSEWGSPQNCLTGSPDSKRGLCMRIEGTIPVVANRPPEAVFGQRLHSARVGSPFSLDISSYFTDPENDALTYTQTGLPQGLTLDTSTGVISGTPAAALGNTFYTLELSAQDPGGLSDEAFIHLRVLADSALELETAAPDTLVRCTTAPVEGSGDLLLPLSFDTADQCPDPGSPACRVPDPEETITLATVSVSLDHPTIGDLGLALDFAGGALDLLQPSDCSAADAHAVFSDRAPWRADRRCNATGEASLLGPLAPSQRLAALRNRPVTGSGPFSLAVENASSETARVNRWCMAVQVNRDGLPVYPQAELPGSADIVSMVTENNAARSGTIAYPGEIDWYRVEQNVNCIRNINVSLQPSDTAPVPQLFLESGLVGLDPGFPDGSCVEAQALPNYTRNSKGFFFVRVQSCPDGGVGPYELTFEKTGFLCEVAGGLGIGTVAGTVREADSGLPLGGAYLELESGEAAFSSPADGSFRLGAAPIASTSLTVFSPAHAPLQLTGITVIEGDTTDIGQLDLDATTFPAPVVDGVFASGFE